MHIGLFIIVFCVFFSAVSGQDRETKDLFRQGVLSSQSGENDKALAAFERVLTRAQNEKATKIFLAKAYYNRGVSLYHLGRFTGAAADLETAIRMSKGKYERAFYALGMARAELRQWNAAEEAFLRAVSMNGKNGEAWFDLAFAHLALNDHPRARIAFGNAIRYGTVDKAISHNNLGVLLALENDNRSAERHFREALYISNGLLQEAIRNLEYCRQKQEGNGRLTAKEPFEFAITRL